MDQTMFVIIIAWLILLSGVVFYIFIYFKRLSQGVEKGNLIKILENLITKEADNEKEIRLILKSIKNIEEDDIYHIQKVGIVRFNPFRELGGDHSFSLALLNKVFSGFVITGLHTRERTRVYVKVVESGKSKFELSDEEKEAIKRAQKG